MNKHREAIKAIAAAVTDWLALRGGAQLVSLGRGVCLDDVEEALLQSGLSVALTAPAAASAPLPTISEGQLERIRKYLDDDCQMHLQAPHHKWRLDSGKLFAALEHAGVMVLPDDQPPPESRLSPTETPVAKAPWHEGGPLQRNQRIIRAVVPRPWESTAAIVEALVRRDFGEDDDNSRGDVDLLSGHIGLAVTEWAKGSPEGREALQRSGPSFNVGDLAGELDLRFADPAWDAAEEDSLERHLRRQGILALRIDTHLSTQEKHSWEYDDHLFDRFEVEDNSSDAGD